MTGLIYDPKDQPGLEVAPEREFQQQQQQQQSPWQQASTKEAVPPPMYNIDPESEKGAPEKSRICGMARKTFWIVLAVVLVVLAAALGGGLGGGLASSSNSKKSTQSSAQSSSSSSSSMSATATTSSGSTSSSTSTSSSATASATLAFTVPGTYRLVNQASNTAMDLLYGDAANMTQLNGWEYNQTALPGEKAHQAWAVADAGKGQVTLINAVSNSFVTAYTNLTTGLNPSLNTDARVYGENPGDLTNPYSLWTLVPQDDGTVVITSVAYPGKSIDLAAGGSSNGTPLLLWQTQNSINQKFKFIV